MRVNIDGTARRKKYPCLDDYDSHDEAFIDIVQMGSMELKEHIEEKLKNKPERGSKLFSRWKSEVNSMIREMNERFGKEMKQVR